jgi:hypothetical protein
VSKTKDAEKKARSKHEIPDKVFVVAWESESSAGFDWYYTEEAAKRGWKKEKENADELAKENWTAFYFEWDSSDVGPMDAEGVTKAIHAQLSELCDAAKKYQKKKKEDAKAKAEKPKAKAKK